MDSGGITHILLLYPFKIHEIDARVYMSPVSEAHSG